MLGRQLESCAARATTPSRFRSMPRHQDAAVGHDGAHLTICALSQVAFDWDRWSFEGALHRSLL